jgi:hypothetical protein
LIRINDFKDNGVEGIKAARLEAKDRMEQEEISAERQSHGHRYP